MANGEFTDKVKIQIKAGDGGDGMNSFKAYKGKPACGPDGGDGGRGGDVWFVGDKDMNDLFSFRFSSRFFAENGERGGTNQCSGRSGKSVYIKVPLGTLVRDAETGRLICDVFADGEQFLVARGGNGGKGNVRFTTARRHAPDFAQKGERVKKHEVILEMKVIADVGLVGFPNVGKSTLLGKISAARPKVANYHFTTLSPNLGVVRRYENSFVAADIPGLIEGAAEGAGLGHDFLRHIERTRMLCHVVDISGCEGRDPVDDFEKINAELKGYSEKLAALPQVVACNKCDLPGAEDNLEAFRKAYGDKYQIYPIAALTGGGTGELLEGIFAVLATLPPVEPVPVEEAFEYRADDSLAFEIYRDENGAFVVVGGLVDILCRNVVLNKPESMQYFQKVLRLRGVVKKLEEMGCKEGDTVSIGDVEFDFIP
ncbi:MAG TPA: GTPase ObgE [Candidatus Scatosoma pullicola]|nr:GTPase ObgE [Candidatus Scatosoma pullicola]